MPDKKLTDNDIVKALECCASEQYTCGDCPYQEIKHYRDDEGFEIMPNGKRYDDWSCERWLNVDLLDLINRLQEKNEELVGNIDKLKVELFDKTEQLEVELKAMRGAANGFKAENEKLKQNLNIELENYATEYDNKIKTEAYKEFAERLKREKATGMNWFGKEHYSVNIEEIDNLLKELAGEDNEK